MNRLEAIKELRLRTNVSIKLCKEALNTTTDDNIEKAIEHLRAAGEIKAQDISDRVTTEGAVVAYVHPGSLMGAMVQVDCESDFVAKSEPFLAFANDVAMHIVASKPIFVHPSEALGSEFMRREELFATMQMNLDPKMAGKPEQMKAKIMSGKIDKRVREVCLLDQPFIKDPSKTIEDLRAELVLKVGENIKIVQFARFDVRASNSGVRKGDLK